MPRSSEPLFTTIQVSTERRYLDSRPSIRRDLFPGASDLKGNGFPGLGDQGHTLLSNEIFMSGNSLLSRHIGLFVGPGTLTSIPWHQLSVRSMEEFIGSIR